MIVEQIHPTDSSQYRIKLAPDELAIITRVARHRHKSNQESLYHAFEVGLSLVAARTPDQPVHPRLIGDITNPDPHPNQPPRPA